MFNLQIIEDRIMSIISPMKLSKNKFLQDAGVQKNFFDSIHQGKVPSVEKVYIIAEYLDISTDFILGRTSISNTKDTEISRNALEIAKLFDTLSPEHQDSLQTIITAFAEDEKREMLPTGSESK